MNDNQKMVMPNERPSPGSGEELRWALTLGITISRRSEV